MRNSPTQTPEITLMTPTGTKIASPLTHRRCSTVPQLHFAILIHPPRLPIKRPIRVLRREVVSAMPFLRGHYSGSRRHTEFPHLFHDFLCQEDRSSVFFVPHRVVLYPLDDAHILGMHCSCLNVPEYSGQLVFEQFNVNQSHCRGRGR